MASGLACWRLSWPPSKLLYHLKAQTIYHFHLVSLTFRIWNNEESEEMFVDLLNSDIGSLLLWCWSRQVIRARHIRCPLQGLPLCWYQYQWHQWGGHAWPGFYLPPLLPSLCLRTSVWYRLLTVLLPLPFVSGNIRSVQVLALKLETTSGVPDTSLRYFSSFQFIRHVGVARTQCI